MITATNNGEPTNLFRVGLQTFWYAFGYVYGHCGLTNVFEIGFWQLIRN